MGNFLSWLGLGPSEEDKELKDLVSKSSKSVRVVGRGTIHINHANIRKTPEYQRNMARAKRIVESHS